MVLRMRDTAAGEGFFPGVRRVTVPVVVVAAAAVAVVAVASVHTTEVLQLVLGYRHHGCGTSLKPGPRSSSLVSGESLGAFLSLIHPVCASGPIRE